MARKGTLRRRLRALAEREQDQRRDLGVLVLQMFRQDRLDERALGRQAEELAGLERQVAELGEPPAPEAEEVEPASSVREATLAPAAAGRGAEWTVPAAEGSDEDEARRSLGYAVANAKEAQITEQRQPDRGEGEAWRGIDELTVQVDDAEQRVREAAEAARREAEERATAEILALEEDLEREQQRAAGALEELQTQLEQAEERASRADEERRRGESEARAAAAEWLRGQAEAMRREAERQVRGELAGEVSPAAGGPAGEVAQVDPERVTGLEAAKEEAERALAEMTQRSNEANARAQQADSEGDEMRRQLEQARAAERRSREQLETSVRELEERAKSEADAGRAAAEERLGAELRTREEELLQEREAKASALQAAEQRLAEIEGHVLAAAERVEGAERQLSEEAERIRAQAEKKIAAETAAARKEVEAEVEERLAQRESELEVKLAEAEGRLADAERRAGEAEQARSEVAMQEREAAVAWLRGQTRGIRREVEAEVEQESRRPEVDLGRPSSPAPPPRARPKPKSPAPAWLPEEGAMDRPSEAPVSSTGRLSVNSATFEQLRELGMSVTQANRLIAYRERLGGYSDLDELDGLPGFPRSFLEDLKSRLDV